MQATMKNLGQKVTQPMPQMFEQSEVDAHQAAQWGTVTKMPRRMNVQTGIIAAGITFCIGLALGAGPTPTEAPAAAQATQQAVDASGK